MLIILIVFSFLTGCTSKQDLAAKVNDEVITKMELEVHFNIYKMVLEFMMVGPDFWTLETEDGKIKEDAMREIVLQALIEEKLQMKEAEKKGIKANEEEIQNRINEMKELSGGEENFKKHLQQHGFSEENIEDVIIRTIILAKYRNSIISELTITEENLRQFFNENKESFIQLKTRHILVSTEEEAREIIEELNEGKDFSELAKQKSIAPNAAMGGILNYFIMGQIINEYEEVAFSLEVENISEPVKTDDGYYIIQLMEKIEEFEDLKGQVNAKYEDKKFSDKIEELKSKADIKIYSEEE